MNTESGSLVTFRKESLHETVFTLVHGLRQMTEQQVVVLVQKSINFVGHLSKKSALTHNNKVKYHIKLKDIKTMHMMQRQLTIRFIFKSFEPPSPFL